MGKKCKGFPHTTTHCGWSSTQPRSVLQIRTLPTLKLFDSYVITVPEKEGRRDKWKPVGQPNQRAIDPHACGLRIPKSTLRRQGKPTSTGFIRKSIPKLRPKTPSRVARLNSRHKSLILNDGRARWCPVVGVGGKHDSTPARHPAKKRTA